MAQEPTAPNARHRWLGSAWTVWAAHVALLLLVGLIQDRWRPLLDAHINDPAMMALHERQTPSLNEVMLHLSDLGDGAAIAFGYVVLMAWSLSTRDRPMARRVSQLMLGSAVMAGIGKAVFSTPRPELWTALESASGSSFPSSHASGSLSLALALSFVIPVRWQPAFVPALLSLALGVGLARVHIGVHAPSDIVLTWLLVASWAIWVTFCQRPSAGSPP